MVFNDLCAMYKRKNEIARIELLIIFAIRIYVQIPLVDIGKAISYNHSSKTQFIPHTIFTMYSILTTVG